MQKHRIYTNVGRDQKINVEILSDYDIMEILSLKFTQKDIFASGNCSEYGVVVGRISANNGYGVPNARVSIFVPEEDLDENDPVIHSLYPYKDIGDKNDENYRYNLLPSRQQHPGHTPTGTFFDQKDILTREEVLEVFEKYYSFTVKTNNAGDFMIWGVPVGAQILHVDIDLSDIGCFSLRPNDFLNKGYGIEQFESYYKFKSSPDIDSLPQIVSFDKTVEIYPFWGNEELCEIGITRTDFDLSERDIKIEPVSIILFSSVTDESSHAVKRNGRIRRNSGYKCNLQTSEGHIECVRYTGKSVIGSDGVTKYPELEYFNPTETINEDGVAMVALPMNIDYVYTNELGEQEITNDKNKGIPTGAVVRFRFSLDFQSNKVATAKYLIPNIREFTHNNNGTALGFSDGSEYQESMLATYQFSDVFEDYLTITPPITGVTIFHTNYDDTVKEHKKNLMLSGATAPQDYFYRFIYGKVYAVSSFHGTHYETRVRDAYLGIKEIRPNVESDCASSANYFPTNFAFKNRIKFNVIISQVLLFLQYLFSIITIKFAEILGKTAYNVGRAVQGFKPLAKVGQRIEDFAYRTQDRYTKELPLTIYPDCEECTGDSESLTNEGITFENSCRRAEIAMTIRQFNDNPFIPIIEFRSYYSEETYYFSNSEAPGSTFLTELFPGDSAAQADGGCDGAQVVNYSMLDWLSTQTLDDGTPRYGVEAFCSGGTQSFDSFADYLQISTDENRSLFFVEDIIFGYPGMRMGINFNFWYELTNMNLNVQQERDWFFDTIAPYIKIVFRIYDRSVSPDEVTSAIGSTMSIEAGCDKYDKLYDESITLRYLWCTAATPTYNSIVPVNPDRQELGGIYIEEPGYGEFTEAERVATHPYLISTIAGEPTTKRMPVEWNFANNYILGVLKIKGIGLQKYDRKTKSGLTEFRDGLFTIIPVINGPTRNLKVLREWYRRKRVGLSFCGGVVNYSFIDNWLHGVLYFFKFDKRIRWDTEATYDLNQRGSKYPRELVFYNIFDKNFYYRSTPYVFEDGVGSFSGQTYEDKKEILHPTTFFDLGIRDEFLGEICTDVRTDPACSVVRDITITSYQDPANVVEYAINYRLDTTQSKFDVDDFFSKTHLGSNIKVFDGDITQLMSINCEAGIEAFDLDSPHYFMFNGEYMDPEDNRFGTYFKIGTLYGPTPIDLKLDFNGVYMRLCLNYRLGDNSQVVPFYLWEKEGPGFGQYGDHSDDQTWDKTAIASMPLQRIFSISGITETKTNYLMADGEEEYILKPMTINHETFSLTGDTEDMLERFEVIDYLAPDPNNVEQYVEGDLWLQALSWGSAGPYKDPWIGYIYVVVNKIWVIQPELYVSDTSGESQENIRETFVPQTAINYWGEINNAKQVLSTPFLFYFGLKPGKTALDLLIKYYGPKDVFTPEEEIICAVSEITTTPIPSGSIPVPSSSPILPSPTPPAPSPSPLVYYYRLNKCIENNSNYYATSSTGAFLSTGTGVWGGINCDPNYAYVVIDHQLDESIYINAGYQNIGMVSASQFRPCFDCDGNPITPPPTPPPYVTITLVRNENNSNPAESMCGHTPAYASRIVMGYVLEPYIIPRTAGYTVYPNNSFITPITTTGTWGILYDSNPEVAWTITIGSTGQGQISDWTECPSPYPANTIIGQTITSTDPEWDGYYINNSYKQNLFFTNNAITSVNTSMYMLKAGDDYQTSTNNNLDYAEITGNKLTWNGTQTGSIITHGLFAGYNINQIIKWNYLRYVPYGIIFKSGAYGNPNMNITYGSASYNIVNGGRFAGRCKGINGSRFYNNTFYGDAGSWYLMLINENSDGEPTYPGNPSINTKVKNNIFYTTTKTPSISIDTGSLSGFECDYNIYWCEAGDHTPVFAIDGSTRTWAEWRALGYDAHSVVVNPNFTNMEDFIPTARLDYGTDLGTEFNTGLSTAATWVVGVTPATRIQSGTWQVGARIFA